MVLDQETLQTTTNPIVASDQTYISENEEKSTVHNYFLLMLAEQGLVGLIIYTAFVFYLLMYIEKLYHTQINKNINCSSVNCL